MIKTAITFTDAQGTEHICHKVGRKVIVSIPQYAKSLEEEFIYAVRTATNDSSVRPDSVRLVKNPKANSYVLKTDSSFYFVRKHNSHIEIMVDEYGMGFYAGLVDHYLFKAHSEGDTVIFWMIDKNTNTRVGHYNYFAW